MKGKFTIGIKSIIAFFVLLVLLVSNASPILAAATTKENELSNDDIEATLEMAVEKFVNYDNDNKEGVILQVGVKTGFKYKDGVKYTPENYLPIMASSVLANATIDGKSPSSAILLKSNTLATNNNLGEISEQDNKSNGIKIITTNINRYSEYVEGAQDYYSIVFYYDADCYSPNNAERTVKLEAKVEEQFAGDKKIKERYSVEKEEGVDKNIGNLITTDIKTEDIYNGFIKANKQYNTMQPTRYTETIDVEILKGDIGEETTIELNTLMNKNNEEKETDQIVYKKIELNKQDVLDILGEDGYLKIVLENGKVIRELKKDTDVDENGIFKYEFSDDQNKAKIVTSTPKKAGILEIKATKDIKGSFTDTEVSKIQEISKITSTRKEEKKTVKENTTTNANTTIEKNTTVEETKNEITEKEVYTNTDKKEIEILDSKTEVEFLVDNKNWTNKKQNEVNFNIELLSSDSKHNLFKNPVFEIQLPSEVEDVNIGKDIQLINGKGLEIKDASFNKENNKIVVVLEGEQKEYIEKVFADGATLVIPTIIDLNRNIQNTEKEITLTYINNATLESGEHKESITLEDYKVEEDKKDDGNEALPTENEPSNEQAEEQNQEQKPETEQEEPVSEEIKTKGIEVTVSPTRGDTVLENEDVVYEGEFIKYNIKIKNTTDETLKNIKLKAVLPEGLVYAKYQNNFDEVDKFSDFDYSETTKNVYVNIEKLNPGKEIRGYFEAKVSNLENESEEKDLTTYIYGYVEDKLADKYEITHKIQKSEYSVTATAMRRGTNLFIIALDIEDKEEKDEDVKLKWNLPEAFLEPTLHTDGGINGQESNMVETNDKNEVSVKPGRYYLTVGFNGETLKLDSKDYEDLFSNFEVNDKYKSNELLTRFYYRSVSVELDSETKGNELKYEDEFSYNIKIANTTKIDFDKVNEDEGKEINYIQVTLKDYLPAEIDPISIKYNNYKYDDKEEKYEEIEKEEKIDGETYDSQNTKNPNIDLDLTIPYGESVEVEVTAKAGLVEKKATINNSAIIYNRVNNTNLAESNIITHTILPWESEEEPEEQTEPEDPEEPTEPTEPTEEPRRQITPEEPTQQEEPTQPTQPAQQEEPTQPTQAPSQPENVEKYSISGLAWNDLNEDGKRQENEQTLNGIEVLLIDSDGKTVATVKTANNGKYTFENIATGKYLVIYKFNSTKYRATTYHKASVGEEENSDAIDTERVINGAKIRCGVTDQINLTKNISNLDVGLIENKTFNFKVDKYITKVSVKTENGTTENVFNNTKLAKTEIRAKEIEGATVLVEYKIVVTNNGEMPGKVGTIVDTLPQGLEFSSELNSAWAKNVDGTILNNSLSGTIIEAGKSVELKLLATKTMTGESVGTFTNKAEITNISNDAKIKEQSENDNISTAELIISVGTGGVVYIFSGIIALIILIGIAILIRKNQKFNKALKKTGFMMLLLGLIFATPITSNANIKDDLDGRSILFVWPGGPVHYTLTTYDYGYTIDWGCNERTATGTRDGTYQWKTISVTETSHTKTKSVPAEANWDLKKTDAGKITMHEVGDYIIVGPLGIENVGNYNCTNFVFTVDGNTYTTVCDSEGRNEHATNQSGVYYLKIPKTDRIRTITAYAEIEYEITWHHKVRYKLFAEGGQKMSASKYEEYDIPDKQKKPRRITWRVDTCNLKIQKSDEYGVDEDGNRLDLSGINFIIAGDTAGDKFLVTDKDGKTKSLEGLNPGRYTVYEIISGGDGSKDLPERLRDYYKASETYGGYNVKKLGTAYISSGQIYTYNAVNKRDYTGLQIKKVDSSNSNNLEGIKFKVKDKETGKWVQFAKNSKGQYYVSGETSSFEINDVTTTLMTNQDGLTDRVKRFEIRKTYEIYEVDVGEYKYLYDIGPRNGGTSEGLLIKTWRATSDQQGYAEVTAYNNQFFGAFKIVKKLGNTKAELEGIGFKIRVKTSENDQDWKWLAFKENNEGELVAGDEFVSYTSAGVLYTDANGETEEVIKAPIYTDSSRKNKYIYEVYEVYIPEDLREVLTLDTVSYTKLYDIINNESAVRDMKSIADFKLEKDVQTNNKYRAVVVLPSNDDNKDAVYNKQAYIKIRGNVWQEILKFKNSVSEINSIKDRKEDGLRDDELDYDIDGIKVELIDNKGNVVYKTVEFGAKATEPQVTYTADHGNYEFEYVILGEGANDTIGLLKEGYKVRFVYDGVTYESVEPYKLADEGGIPNPRTSKAAEEFKSADNRQSFNNNWERIEKDTVINTGTNSVKLEYDQSPVSNEDGELTGKIVNLKKEEIIYKRVTNDDEKLVTVTGDPKFIIEADTEAGKLKQYYETLLKAKINAIDKGEEKQDKILRSIDNINLGLYVRERPNLTLQKDEHMAHVTVNDKQYTYVYNSKLKMPETEEEVKKSNETGLWEENPELYENPEVKFDAKTKRSLPIYEADINYGTDPSQDDSKALQATITYKIKLHNASNNLYAKINSINEYFTTKSKDDERMTIKNVYLSDDEFKLVFNESDKIGYKEVEADDNTVADSYKGTKIVFDEPITLGSVTSMDNIKFLYIEFNIENIREYFYSVLYDIPDSSLENYAEIASYSVYSDKEYQKLFAGVDSTSIPGDLNVANYEQDREDDSDKALGLRVVKAEERKLEGIVFEDAPVQDVYNENGDKVRTIDGEHQINDGSKTITINNKDGKVSLGEERIGNGIYDISDTANAQNMDGLVDKPVENVEVNLVQVGADGATTTAKVWQPAERPTSSNPGAWVDAKPVRTASDGTYSIGGLPTGEFKMEFKWGGSEYGNKDLRNYKCTVFVNPESTRKDGNIVMNDEKGWVYKENPRYSDAIDNYNTRQAIDAKELKVENTAVQSIIDSLDEDWNKVTMISTTPKFTIGIEKKQNDQDVDNGTYKDEKNTLTKSTASYLPFKIGTIDFGIIERARQGLGVEKHVKTLNIKTADGQPVVIAYIDNDGKLKTIAGEEYVTGGYDLGYLWAQIDKQIEQDMTVEIEYSISVQNYSELDYDDIDYYLFGNRFNNVIKLSADNLYDYVSGTSAKGTEDKWQLIERASYPTEATDTELLYEELYKTGKENMLSTIRSFNYTERAKGNIAYVFDKFATATDIEAAAVTAEDFKNRKLSGREILRVAGDNELITEAYLPSEKRTETLQTSRLVGTGEEIEFNNDVEITRIKLADGIKTGRKHDIRTAPLYDVAEGVTITPATGGNKDFMGLTIAIIGSLTVLGCGIFLIKKYVKK